MTAPMIRADAPELLALVEALRGYKTHSRRVPYNIAVSADRALAAWEAIAPKHYTDAITPWGIQPDGSGLDPATLPIHRDGKAGDNA